MKKISFRTRRPCKVKESRICPVPYSFMHSPGEHAKLGASSTFVFVHVQGHLPIEEVRPKSLPTIPPCNLTWEDYIADDNTKAPVLGRKSVVKINQKAFKPVVAMSNKFPFTTEDFLNILQFIAQSKVGSSSLLIFNVTSIRTPDLTRGKIRIFSSISIDFENSSTSSSHQDFQYSWNSQCCPR